MMEGEDMKRVERIERRDSLSVSVLSENLLMEICRLDMV